MPTKIVVEL